MVTWSAGKGGDTACRVLDAAGHHVGNLKWIGGVWKFKAIGQDSSGAVIPGGGPLTDRHNTVFSSLDEAQIRSELGNVFTAHPTPRDIVLVRGK